MSSCACIAILIIVCLVAAIILLTWIHARSLNKMGQEHKKSQEAIRSLNKDLVSYTLQLEDANQELEAFSYTVSHDLRSPLRAMDGFARILCEEHAGQLDEEGLRILRVVRDNAKKMSSLIDGLLEFSRMGRYEIHYSEVDMNAVVQSVFEELRQFNSSLNPQFHLEALPPALGDAVLFRQVWINLLSNAFKYSKRNADAYVHVSSQSNADEITYMVKDNGAGFDMKYASKLFGVFQRLHEQSEFEGVGVGLAIVKRIIQRHRGRIWAEGIINKGASFYFTLPKENHVALT